MSIDQPAAVVVVDVDDDQAVVVGQDVLLRLEGDPVPTLEMVRLVNSMLSNYWIED